MYLVVKQLRIHEKWITFQHPRHCKFHNTWAQISLRNFRASFVLLFYKINRFLCTVSFLPLSVITPTCGCSFVSIQFARISLCLSALPPPACLLSLLLRSCQTHRGQNMEEEAAPAALNHALTSYYLQFKHKANVKMFTVIISTSFYDTPTFTITPVRR